MHLAFARQGTLAIPTTLGFLDNAPGLTYLRAWVAELSSAHLLQPANPNLPTEIHILTMGFSGFGVDIKAWSGVLEALRAYDDSETSAERGFHPTLVERVYLVPCVDPHVIDGSQPWSLNPGVDYLAHPQKFFHGFNSKCF
jgi:hypothetical protein